MIAGAWRGPTSTTTVWPRPGSESGSGSGTPAVGGIVASFRVACQPTSPSAPRRTCSAPTSTRHPSLLDGLFRFWRTRLPRPPGVPIPPLQVKTRTCSTCGGHPEGGTGVDFTPDDTQAEIAALTARVLGKSADPASSGGRWPAPGCSRSPCPRTSGATAWASRRSPQVLTEVGRAAARSPPTHAGAGRASGRDARDAGQRARPAAAGRGRGERC